jgi:hypothetical protein
MSRFALMSIAVVLATGAHAQTPPPTCRTQALAQNLDGTPFNDFISKCRAKVTGACTIQADTKKLVGGPKDGFINKCVSDATGL